MTAVAAVVLLSAIVGAAAVTTAAASSSTASAAPHDNGIGTNYTVSLPNEQSHQPGATGADIRHYSAANGLFEETSSPKGFERIDTLTIWSEDITFGTCSTENTRAFGIDRDNDNEGTHTDEGLLAHRKNSAFNEHSIYVNFYGEGSLAGEPVSLQNEDQIVAAQNGCYGMPSEPGWYQINARINGTGYNGNYIDSAQQGTIRSHYFYVCDCASEQEAREKLGPPPSESGGSDDGGSEGGNGDDGSGDDGSTPTATPTPTATSGQGSGDDTATATSTSDSGDSTPTATQSDRAGRNTPTATGSGDVEDDTATTTGATDTGGATATATSAATAGNATSAGTAENGGSGGGANESGGAPKSGGQTPTDGSGPGFGIGLALVALAGAALLAARRNE